MIPEKLKSGVKASDDFAEEVNKKVEEEIDELQKVSAGAFLKKMGED